MRENIEALEVYNKLLKIKKMIFFFGTFTGIFLLFGIVFKGREHDVLSNIFIILAIVFVFLTVLLGLSVKPIKKYILKLVENK